MILAHGRFEGRGGHILRGSFVLRAVDGETHFETSEDFYFDGSPVPGFAWSQAGRFDEQQALTHGFLRLPGSGSLSGQQIEVTGRQHTKIAPGFEPQAFDAVFLWCFGVPFLLGVAKLEFPA